MRVQAWDYVAALNSNMELLILFIDLTCLIVLYNLNSNMELLISGEFKRYERDLNTFKFQYGATNITYVSVFYFTFKVFKFQYGATNIDCLILDDLRPSCNLNSNVELLIFTIEFASFSATETFKFQYGATNINFFSYSS